MEPLSRITPATVDVLAVLTSSSEPTWGLLVIKASGRPAGTVYPILERLERSGWLTSQWEEDDSRPGPRRRLYELTVDGAAAARSTVATRATRAAKPAAAPLTARVVTA